MWDVLAPEHKNVSTHISFHFVFQETLSRLQLCATLTCTHTHTHRDCYLMIEFLFVPAANGIPPSAPYLFN